MYDHYPRPIIHGIKPSEAKLIQRNRTRQPSPWWHVWTIGKTVLRTLRHPNRILFQTIRKQFP
jgi:hypothetical protein